jgi:hypothetical protein
MAAMVTIAAVVVVILSLHGSATVDRGGATAPALPIGQTQTVARSPDPAGGEGWVLRERRTGTRSACLQLGRLNGRFVPISKYHNGLHCAQTDAAGHLFLDLAVIDASAGPEGRRDLYYGTLGPDAVTITYRSATGRSLTQRVGADGGYLIVEPAALPVAVHPRKQMRAWRQPSRPHARRRRDHTGDLPRRLSLPAAVHTAGGRRYPTMPQRRLRHSSLSPTLAAVQRRLSGTLAMSFGSHALGDGTR